MHKVEPIRSIRKITAIKNILKAQDHPRDYLLFVLGINTALRISDLLSLKVKDVLDSAGEVKPFIYIREQKTRKSKKIRINKNAKQALDYYFENIDTIEPDAPLFKSHRSEKPLDRTQVYRLIQDWTEDVGLTQARYGCHSLRKTWGYIARKKHGISLEVVMEKLGHSSPSITKRYIGISDDEIEQVENNVLI